MYLYSCGRILVHTSLLNFSPLAVLHVTKSWAGTWEQARLQNKQFVSQFQSMV